MKEGDLLKINILSKHIADLIAAGEVVDRPASVVKEAVENSIDAGASVITVEIKNGGVSYIRITDNGTGIASEDVRNAFISHATSKVATADDLSAIGTLGFRGEALASIAAVSKVEIFTKTSDEPTGTHYSVEGGEEIFFDDAGCPDGTTLIVRDIFYNTPARMKFLKKDVSEANAVCAVVDRISLSHPEISFRMIREGKETLFTPGDGKLLSTIHSVYGKDFAESLISTEYHLNDIKISGYVSKPLFARANRSMQFFFINNRLVKTKTAMAALEQAYKNSIAVGKFPSCVLNISLPNYLVDVNVHPSKLEVRFADEKKVFDCIYYGVKNVIEEKDSRPQVDLSALAVNKTFFPESDHEQIRLKSNAKNNFWQNKSSVNAFKEELPQNTENKFIEKSNSNVSLRSNTSEYLTPKIIDEHTDFAEKSFEIKEIYAPKISEETKVIEQMTPQNKEDIEIEFKVIGEAFKSYIFVEVENKVIIIDKHAAHERIIFEKLKKENESFDRQVLLMPVNISLSKEEYSILLDNTELLEKTGYIIGDFGVGNIVVTECPLIMQTCDITEIIQEIAGYLLKNKTEVFAKKIDWIFQSSACRSAIKAGDFTSEFEMEKFVENLLKNEDIKYCPHGRPVLVEIKKSDVEKFFGRI